MIRILSRTWWFSAILYVSTACYVLFQGGKTSLMLFAILNVLGVYLMLGRWSGIGGVQGERAIETHGGSSAFLMAGMRIGVRLRLQIPGFWPLPYIIVREKLVRKTGGESQTYEMSFVPDYRRRGEVRFETAPLRRGQYVFESTDCSTRDLFGLFEHKGSFARPHELQVMPRTIELKDWRLFRRTQRGVFHQTYTSQWAKETTQIDGVREYIHGDRLSRIHWNATAKTGQWKSKEFEREALPRIVFLLDRNRDNYKTAEQFELAVSVAASLVELTARKRMPLGFVSVGRFASWFGEGHTAVTREQLMQHLIEVEADGTTALGETLCRIAERYEPGVHIVMVTAAVQEDTVSAIAALESKRMLPSVIHIADKNPLPEESAKLRHWQWLCQSKQWEFCSVSYLEQLPQALGVGGA